MRFKLSILSLLFTCGIFAQAGSELVPHAYSYNVDNYPDVYGGREEWKRFFHDHMVYPEIGLRDKEEGGVKIYFTVTKEGKGIGFKVVESVGTTVDNEALRLLSLLEWFPPSQGGEPIESEHSITMNFSINKYKRWVKDRGYEKTPFSDLPIDSSIAVYEKADKAPTFNNKDQTFPEFVYSNMEYPEMAKVQNMQGSIVMNFIIEPNGRTSNIRINKGIGAGCNEEAIRLIGATKWKPAQKNGKYVRYRMYYTMLFKLENNFKDNSSGSQRVGG